MTVPSLRGFYPQFTAVRLANGDIMTKLNRLSLCAALVATLAACNDPSNDGIRNGPQTEPHVTYANTDSVSQRTVSGGQSQTSLERFTSICGAGNPEAAERAAAAMGVFNAPSISDPGIYGGRSALFEDGRRDAVLIATGPNGYQCLYTDGTQTWTWWPGGQVTVEAAQS